VSVSYITDSRDKELRLAALPLRSTTSLDPRTDPKAARTPRIALPRAEGQERWRCTMAKKTIVPIQLPGGFVVKKQYGSRYWMVIDPVGELVCLTVYKKGAMEVVRRLAA
jgi:hypothetical protein